jgi:zinc protease
MKIFISIIIAILLFLPAGCVHVPRDTEAHEKGYVHEEILPNGLKVLVLRDESAPLAVFQIWYRAGSVNEQVGKTGLSHLLEHMMFKGTPSYGPKDFSRIIKRAGGIDNAATSKDYAFYYQKLESGSLHLSIKLESDRMQNLILDENEASLERDVVMEERRLRYEDDPQNLVYEEVISAAFRNHPYRWPVIGWMSDLEDLTGDDLRTYYRTYYVPNNATIVVAGDVDTDGLMKKIRAHFGSIPRGLEIPVVTSGEPEQRGERRIFVKKEAKLPYVFIAYKAPNILDKDSYALDVLTAILAEGRSSRIYKNIVDEQQIALSAGAGYGNIQKYPYILYLYGTALPGMTIGEVEEALYDEVERIKDTPPSEREVQKVKNQIEADFIMDQDSIFSRATLLGRFEMIGDWRLLDKYLEGIRSVTPADVQRVAQTYLIEDKRTVGILVPLKGEKNGI